MAKETVYNNTLVSGAADETLTYTRYVKDESSGKSTKELLDEKVNKTDQLGTTQIADKAVTTEKLENESVTTDKLNAASVTTDKVADANITTSKLADSSVETEKINNKAVTTDKLNDGAVVNSKLSPNAVTSEKIKDESIITEKLNDRAVTTEKVEEKAITNEKIGDSAVDGRTISEASVEKKHLANDSVATEKLQDSSVTSDKIHNDAITEGKIKDSSVSNSKLADNSVGTSKIKDGNITNEKVANNTLTLDKLDPELRKSIQAATGLPENLVETIQDVDKEVKSLHSKDTDLQSQITDKQQQITAHDKDIELLQTRSTQMEQTINNIAATGGASVANTVAYTNTTSGLESVNAQGAIDELAAKNKAQDATISANASEVETKFTEESERVNGELAKKANAEDVTTQIQTEQERVNAEFAKKFDKESILQESGDAEDKVMSQKSVSAKFSDLTSDISNLAAYANSNITIKSGKGNLTPLGSFKSGDVIYLQVLSFSSQENRYVSLLSTNDWNVHLDPSISLTTVNESIIYIFEKDYEQVYLGCFEGTAEVICKTKYSVDEKIEYAKSSLTAQYDDIYNDGSNIHLKGVTFVVKQAGIGLGKAKDITIKKDGNIHYMYWLSSDANTYMPFYSVERYSNSEKKEYFVIEETIDWNVLGTRDIQDCLLLVGNNAQAVFGILANEYLIANTIDISNSYKVNNVLKELYVKNSTLKDIIVSESHSVVFYRGYKIDDNTYITGFNLINKKENSNTFKTFLVSDYAGDADACYQAAQNYKPSVLNMNGIQAVIDWERLSSLDKTTTLEASNVLFNNKRVLSTTDNPQCGFVTNELGLFNYTANKEEIGALYNTDGLLHEVYTKFLTTDYIYCENAMLFYGNFYNGVSEVIPSACIYDKDKNLLYAIKNKSEYSFINVIGKRYVRFTYEIPEVTSIAKLMVVKTIKDSLDTITLSRYRGKVVYWFGDSLIHNGMIVSAYERLTGCVTKNFAYGAHCLANVNNDELDVIPRIKNNLGNDASLIIISAGVNDFREGEDLGDFETATFAAYQKKYPNRTEQDYITTFYGALHTICQYLIEKYNSKIPIVFLTPMHNAYPIAGNSPDSWEINKDKWQNEGVIKYNRFVYGREGVHNGVTGGTQLDYIEAIKKVACFYGMQVIDTYTINSLQPSITSIANEYFLAKEDNIDGIHPNFSGSERIAKIIYPILEQFDYQVSETNRKFYN